MKKPIVFYFLLVGLSSQVFAEKAMEVDYLLSLSLEELMSIPITTASKQEEKLKDTASTVLVITQQQIMTRRYINLIDLLRDLPGVDVHSVTDETRYHNVTLRGHLGNNKFLILQDGIRIDSPTGEIIPVASNFPLYNAKQVEIVYGPAAALYGADAFGGVINIVTEGADDINGGELSTTAGSDSYRYHYARAGGRINKYAAIAVSGHIHQADNADLSQAYPEAYAPVDAKTSDGKVIVPALEREAYYGATKSKGAFAKLNLFDNVEVGLNYGYFQHPTSTGDKPSTTLFAPEAKWETELKSAYAKYRFEQERLSGETILQYSSYEVLPESRFNNIFTYFQPGYKYAKGSKRSIEQQFTYLFNEQQTLITGLGYESFASLPRTADLSEPFEPGTPFAEQDLYYPGTNNSLPVQFLDTHYTNKSIYLQLHSHWTEKFSSMVGVRYDDNSRYGATTNPRLGFVYQPTDKIALKLLYGQGFRAPSAHESLSTYGTFSGEQNAQGDYISSFFKVPNPNLKPEKVSNWEADLLYQVNEEFTLSLSAYYTKVKDLIATRDETVPTQFIPGGQLLATSISDNLENGEHHGLDIELHYYKNFGQQLEGEFWANYSFIEGTVTKDGTELDLPYVTPHKLKLGATFNYRQHYFITPKIYIFDETLSNKLSSTQPTERLQSPGYVVMDLHLGATSIWQSLSLFFDVYNVFDTHYYNVGSITKSTTFLSTPQSPRTFYLSLKYTF